MPLFHDGLRRSAVFAVPLVLVMCTAASAWVDESDFDSKYRAVTVMDDEYEVNAGGKLNINADDVDVWVQEASGNKARIQVFAAGPDEDDARHFFEEEMDFYVEADGSVITIESRSPHNRTSRFWQRYSNVKVWAIVWVPREFDARIYLSDGDLLVDALDGDVRVRTDDGDIRVRQVRGPSVEIETTDGDIAAGSVKAQEITVESSDGDIEVEEMEGDDVKLSSSDGDVSVSRIEAGYISVKTSDGDIRVGASGDELRVSCSDGDIEVEIFNEMKVDLSSHDGNIRLRVPKSINADFDLRGEDISVSGGIQINGRSSNYHIQGSLNNGGTLVRAKARDGSVSVKAR